MSIFAKKPDWETRLTVEAGLPSPNLGPPPQSPTGGYGIAEAIELMRSLPLDQNGELVVRVVRATLGSLRVQLPDIIDDASRRQKSLQDRISAVHIQIGELEKQLDTHGREIAALEADLKETTTVKERLQQAEKLAGLAGQRPATSSTASGKIDVTDKLDRPDKTPGPMLLSKGIREETTKS